MARSCVSVWWRMGSGATPTGAWPAAAGWCKASRAWTRAPVAVAYRAAQPSARTDSAEPSTPTTTSSCPLRSPFIAARLPLALRAPSSHRTPAGAGPYRVDDPGLPDLWREDARLAQNDLWCAIALRVKLDPGE